jgi:hypothetical protein
VKSTLAAIIASESHSVRHPSSTSRGKVQLSLR